MSGRTGLARSSVEACRSPGTDHPAREKTATRQEGWTSHKYSSEFLIKGQVKRETYPCISIDDLLVAPTRGEDT